MIVCSNQECANHEPHDGARFSAVACAVVDCTGQVECYEDPGDEYVCRLCGSAAGEEEYYEEDGPDPDGQLAMVRYYENLYEQRGADDYDAERQMEAMMDEPDDDSDDGCDDCDDGDDNVNGIPVLCCSNKACDLHDPYRAVFPPFTAVVEVSAKGIPYPYAAEPETTKCPECGSHGVMRHREIRYADSDPTDDTNGRREYDFIVRASMRARVTVFAESIEEAQELFVTRDLAWEHVEYGEGYEGVDANYAVMPSPDDEEDIPF